MIIKAELTSTDKEVTIKFLPSNDSKAQKILKRIKDKTVKFVI